MFGKLFSKNKSEDAPASEEGPASEDGDLRRAVAALLVEAARADDHYEDREKTIIDSALAAMFDLAGAEAGALRAEGEKAQGEALDIQRFTRVAKQLDAAEKITFVEQLWEIVLSDAVRDPYEDALMRRICGLIYLDDRESGAARKRVAARLDTC